MDGAYILSEYGVRAGVPSLILISTGTEVALAVAVAKVRIVKKKYFKLVEFNVFDRRQPFEKKTFL